MPAVDLRGLMQDYAFQGVADWCHKTLTRDEVRKRARECLGPANIADNPTEAAVTLNTIYKQENANRLRFIPMPKRPGTGGIDRCFFLPLRTIGAGGQEVVAFDLFLLVHQKNCLAFRFEPPHRSPTTHGYAHVQMSRKMIRRTMEPSGIPTWLPERYPAFPVFNANPVSMFLAMTTAVHGYVDGIEKLLLDIFQGQPGYQALYRSELSKLLCPSP